jgi:hypothetical protein
MSRSLKTSQILPVLLILILSGMSHANEADSDSTNLISCSLADYPNPFNPKLHINFNLPNKGDVEIEFYDLACRQLGYCILYQLQAGYNTINLEANNAPAGIYFYRIQSGSFKEIKKIRLLK